MAAKREEAKGKVATQQKKQQEVKQQELKETPNVLLVSLELAEALGKYLMTKPMNEVESLVSALRSSRAVSVTNNENKGA